MAFSSSKGVELFDAKEFYSVDEESDVSNHHLIKRL
jgi:hypothetical protein